MIDLIFSILSDFIICWVPSKWPGGQILFLRWLFQRMEKFRSPTNTTQSGWKNNGMTRETIWNKQIATKSKEMLQKLNPFLKLRVTSNQQQNYVHFLNHSWSTPGTYTYCFHILFVLVLQAATVWKHRNRTVWCTRLDKSLYFPTLHHGAQRSILCVNIGAPKSIDKHKTPIALHLKPKTKGVEKIMHKKYEYYLTDWAVALAKP